MDTICTNPSYSINHGSSTKRDSVAGTHTSNVSLHGKVKVWTKAEIKALNEARGKNS